MGPRNIDPPGWGHRRLPPSLPPPPPRHGPRRQSRGMDPPTNDNDAPRPPPWVLRAPLPVSVDALGHALCAIEAYDASGTFIAHMHMPPLLPPIYRREWAELVPYHATNLAMIDRGFRAAVEKCRDIDCVLESSAALDAAEGRYIAYRSRILRRCYAIRDGLLQRAKLGPAMAAAAAARAVARPCQAWVCHQEKSPAYHDLLEGRPPMDAQEDKAAEGHALGQVVGGSLPSEMDKVAEGSELGQVAMGGTTDMEDKGGGIVSRLTVEEPVANSSTAFTIPAKEVRPSGHCRDGVDPALGYPAKGLGIGNKATVGIRGASWGGGTNMGGRGIPWLDRRGRVTAWLNPWLDHVILDEPHLLSPGESNSTTTDFRGGKDPG